MHYWCRMYRAKSRTKQRSGFGGICMMLDDLRFHLLIHQVGFSNDLPRIVDTVFHPLVNRAQSGKEGSEVDGALDHCGEQSTAHT